MVYPWTSLIIIYQVCCFRGKIIISELTQATDDDRQIIQKLSAFEVFLKKKWQIKFNFFIRNHYSITNSMTILNTNAINSFTCYASQTKITINSGNLFII